MENVSKALLMAGGIMLTMLIVSTLLYSITVFSENQEEKERLKATEELTKFNLQFTNYARDDILGYELISLVNKVIDYNQRFSNMGELDSAAGNYFQYTPITLIISFKPQETSKINLFEQLHSTSRTEVNRPAVARSGHENVLYNDNDTVNFYTTEIGNQYNFNEFLFRINHNNTNGIYIQSNTLHQFESILTKISNIETTYTKSGAQGLSKSIGSIFEGKIIRYNGQPPINDVNERKKWFQESYIKDRFKVLTNISKEINDIRSDEVIRDILQYNEYMQFKKASFECYNVEYDVTSQRVSKMEFRYTGDDLK